VEVCDKLICKLLGHKWSKVCAYRVYRQEFQVGKGVAQLYCERSGEWVDVSKKVFNKYYEDYCTVQEQPYQGIERSEHEAGEVCEDCGLIHE